jgi:hypothetical protein
MAFMQRQYIGLAPFHVVAIVVTSILWTRIEVVPGSGLQPCPSAAERAGTLFAPLNYCPSFKWRSRTMDLMTVLAQNDGGGVFVGLGAFVLVIWSLVLAASIFWIWMLIDALMNEPTTNDKILWFLVIFFLHFIGALVYFFVRRNARTRVPG